MRIPRSAPPGRLAVSVALMSSLLLLAGCGDDADSGTGPTVDAVTTMVSGEGTTASSGAGGDLEAAESAAVEVVDAYIDAVAVGDLEGAWDLLDGRSRDALGSFEGFDGLAAALTEGIGAWSGAEDRVTFVHGVGADAWAVTLLGTVAQEGPPALAAVAMMVYADGSTAAVSPFEDPFGESGFVFFDPADASTVAADRAIVFGIPVGVEPAVVLIDDRPVVAESLSSTGADGETRRFAIASPDWPPGDHVVTVVATADSARAAVAAAYTVSG